MWKKTGVSVFSRFHSHRSGSGAWGLQRDWGGKKSPILCLGLKETCGLCECAGVHTWYNEGADHSSGTHQKSFVYTSQKGCVFLPEDRGTLLKGLHV